MTSTVVAIALAPSAARADVPDEQWAALKERAIIVEASEGDPISGKLIGVNKATVVIMKDDGAVVTVQRAQVKDVKGRVEASPPPPSPPPPSPPPPPPPPAPRVPAAKLEKLKGRQVLIVKDDERRLQGKLVEVSPDVAVIEEDSKDLRKIEIASIRTIGPRFPKPENAPLDMDPREMPDAAPAEAPKWSAQREGSRAALGLDLLSTGGATFAAFELTAQISVHKNIAIDLEMPWAFGGGPSNTFAAFGDPSVGAHAVGRATPDLSLFGGFSLAFPTRTEFSSLDQVAFMGAAAATRANIDAHRFVPSFVTLRFPLGLETHFGDYFYYRASITPDIFIPVGSARGGAVSFLEHADELEARAPFGFGGGVRFQAAFILTSAPDRVQTAIEPFVGYESPGPKGKAFARLGLLVALDSPGGWGFDEGKIRTVRIQGGMKF